MFIILSVFHHNTGGDLKLIGGKEIKTTILTGSFQCWKIWSVYRDQQVPGKQFLVHPISSGTQNEYPIKS